MQTRTYLYAYIVFALVYAVAGIVLTVRAATACRRLNRRQREIDAATGGDDMVAFDEQRAWRMVDHSQLATLLPLVYVVCSIFLGSLILKHAGTATLANAVWVLVTVLGTLMCLVLLVRDPGRGTPSEPLRAVADLPDPAAPGRIAARLGLSAVLLGLVTVFMALNAWAVLNDMDRLLQIRYVL